MKRNYITLWFIVIITMLLVAFKPQRTGSVKGGVNPIDGASQVWLVSARDTLRSNIRNGVFEFLGVKPGSCALIIEGIPPYKRTNRNGIEVYEGQETNVGEIYLEQQQK
jgi:hypothetical protein